MLNYESIYSLRNSFSFRPFRFLNLNPRNFTLDAVKGKVLTKVKLNHNARRLFIERYSFKDEINDSLITTAEKYPTAAKKCHSIIKEVCHVEMKQ